MLREKEVSSLAAGLEFTQKGVVGKSKGRKCFLVKDSVQGWGGISKLVDIWDPGKGFFFFFFFPPNQSFLPPPSWHFWWADEKTRIHGIAGWGNFTDELIKPAMKIGPRRGHCTHRASQTNGCDADLSPQQQYGHKARLEGRLQRLRRKSNWACSQLSLTSNGSLSSGNLQDGDIPVFPRQLVPLCLTLTTISFGVIQPALTQFLLISRCSCNILASWLKDPIHLSLQS